MLKQILEAKEQRQKARKDYSSHGLATISFNFNIPGYPKSNPGIKKAFFLVLNELKNYFTASRIQFIENKVQFVHDEAGDICFFPFNESKYDLDILKLNLEAFEENHKLNRLLDIDLFNSKQQPVSSGKNKSCFLCKDKPAIECMRERTHSQEELMTFVQKQINSYVDAKEKESICRDLSFMASQSILMEISLPCKPGLVCPDATGSHKDMNFLTFINSSSAISSYFKDLASLGYDWDGICNLSILQKLRIIGLEMEQSMFQATKGVNTHKGIIFLMGFSLFVSAHVLKIEKRFDEDLFRGTLMLLNKGLVKRELENGWNKDQSHGEKCFNEFGKEFAGGIRQEIEEGLPVVFNHSLPLMKELFEEGLNIEDQDYFNEKLLKVLMVIMSVNNDTNVLFRKDIDTLNNLKNLAFFALKEEGDIYENNFYKDLVDFCESNFISPGGSADLLAISIYIFQLYKNYKSSI